MEIAVTRMEDPMNDEVTLIILAFRVQMALVEKFTTLNKMEDVASVQVIA